MAHRHHALARFLATRAVGRRYRDHHVILSDSKVVQPWLAGCRELVHGHDLFRAVFAQRADDPLGVVDQRDHLDQDAPRLHDPATEVVDVVICANIALALAGNDGLAGLLVRFIAQRRAVDARRALQVVGRHREVRDQGLRRHVRRDALRRRVVAVRIVVKHRVVGPVGVGPYGFMAGQLLRRRCPLGLGRHRDRFGQRAAMQVVNLLRVRGVAHHAAPHRPLAQVDFLAQHRHDRQDRPCPVGRVLQLLGAVHQPHAYLGPQNLAFALDQAGGPQIFQRARLGLFLVFGADNLAVGQAQQRAVNIVLIPVFRDAEFLAAVTKPTGRDAVPAIPCLGPGLGPAALKLALGQHLRDEDVSRVLARRHLRPRIPNDRKRRENRSDSDIEVP